MEDKEVKDKTVPDKAPEKQKDLKKPSGKSATGKPLDGIDINPQLNDVSTDGNQLKIRKEDSVDLTVPVIQERKALTLPQRQQRARQLRARENSMARAREIAKSRLAPSGKIEQRALSHARAIVKKRFAARKGTPYAELTTTEKIQVDTAVAKKTKLIQKIAKRLLPRIRKAEYERLKSFRNGAALQDLSTQNPKAQGIMPKVSEEMSQLFHTLDSSDTNALIGIIENTINQFKQNNNPLGDQLKRMLNAVLPEDVVTESLMKKSEKTGIAFSTLREVFDRGEYSWDASNRMTQEQYAFARVNSYIAKGKAWHMDADLREVKVVNTKLDESFSGFMENYNYHVGLSSSTAKKRESHWKKMQKYSDKDQRAYQDAPGDKAARKKGMPQSEYTKKYHAMYGEEVNESTDPDYHAKVHQDLQWHAGRNRGRSMGAANYHHLMTKDDQSHIEKHYEKTVLPILKKHRYPTPPKGPGDGGNQKYHAAVKEIIKNWEKEPRINESTSSASFMLNMTRKEEVEQMVNEAAAGLTDKAKKSGVSLSVLKKVYARGVAAWNTGHRPGTTPQQWGMARVNSYISKGKGTYHGADKDLREAGPGLWANIHAKRKRIKAGSGERMRKVGEKGAPTPAGIKSAQESVGTEKRKKIEVVDRPPASQAVKTRHAEIQNKIIDESDTPANREIGTNSLVKKYKKDTPGQKSNLDESFNMAWTSGIGVTLSAADCGIKIKAGFELHPDVIDQMQTDEFDEEVRSAAPIS